ncbi:DUF3313 family protein [Silvimonas amylolytica]|uniref:DUF3313 domain-containing protein n=1 Tax=Silvimonas amylolytica TaxID=449663 RepID=A0ABQ2PGK1_9NEIS|nr:DUF3313 family protein [Silvimonas amylolytica]GGP24423.1 hypothetical protein GCM10010971_02420 [Silvimonas amylolytica]
MKKTWLLALVLTMLASAFFNTARAEATTPTTKRAATTAWTEEGLQKAPAKEFDLAYITPGASLVGYNQILLGPIPVSFRRGWEKQAAIGSRLPINTKDVQSIKDNLANVLREELTLQLNAGGYRLVDTAGEGVLEIDLSVVNLDVAAPDTPGASRARTYAVSAGEMTLVAALRDAVTGTTIMRIYDHYVARESFKPEQIRNGDNAQAAHEAAATWAAAIRRELDLAHGTDAR